MTDPYRVLGVPADADDEAIRAAYLAAIRACPPERDQKRFESVRAAFEAIATRSGRLAHALFDVSAPDPRDVLDVIGADFLPRHADEQRLRRLLDAK